jgi:chaperone BCS1
MDLEASDELCGLADRFSSALPEGKFSLAAIQGFLLQYKEDPNKACEEVEDWGKEMLDKEGAN